MSQADNDSTTVTPTDHPRVFRAGPAFARGELKVASDIADAIDDPEAAATIAVELINAGGNPNFLSPEGEGFRWTTDAALIAELTPDGVGFGVADPEGLQNELDTYAEVGLFGDGDAPNADDFLDDILDRVYDDDTNVIWPAS